MTLYGHVYVYLIKIKALKIRKAQKNQVKCLLARCSVVCLGHKQILPEKLFSFDHPLI